MNFRVHFRCNRALAGARITCAIAILAITVQAGAVTKLKLKGYVTGRSDSGAMMILDDRIEVNSATHVIGKDAAGEHAMKPEEEVPGGLTEAGGGGARQQ